MLAGSLAYANGLSGPFLFDDDRSIVTNAQIRQLWPPAVPLSPPDETPVARRPLVNLSFALNYAVSGLDVRGYHVTNVALHLLAALVLFGLIRRTLALPKLAGRFEPVADTIALAGALIWVLHPLQTEAVNYLSQRTELVMGLCYLLTLYCSLRRWHAAALLACVLGMASKESMVTAPLVVLLYDRAFLFETVAAALRARGRLYVGLSLTWVVLAGLMMSGGRTTVGFSTGTGVWTYLLNQAELVVHYLWLAIWPRALVLDYGLPRPLTLADVWLPVLLLVILALVVLIGLRRRPELGFLGAFVFITLAPTSSVVPIATEVGAERRMYLALAALAVLLVVAVHRLGGRRWLVPVAAALSVALAVGTFMRNQDYVSTLTMARTIVDRRPHGRAHFLLGNELYAAGQRDEAIAQFELSARDFPGARFALGTERLAEQRFDDAIAELEVFIREEPDHVNVVPARDMLARAFLAQQRFEEAIGQFQLIQEVAPSYGGPGGDLLFNFGYALTAAGRMREAVPVLERAVTTNPADADARQLLQRVRAASLSPPAQ